MLLNKIFKGLFKFRASRNLNVGWNGRLHFRLVHHFPTKRWAEHGNPLMALLSLVSPAMILQTAAHMRQEQVR